MKISFCTTCANRLYQLERTFDSNLELILRHPDAEWVILNFGSADNLDPFITDRIVGLPSRVVYARLSSHHPWHLSVAKNRAHTLACGDILVNMDCDNFIGDAFDVVREHFGPDINALHLWSGKYFDGTCGRIAITRHAYYHLGGYDESFLPMGYQDLDLLRRAEAAGMAVRHIPSSGDFSLKNSKRQSMEHCGDGVSGWRKFNMRNRQISKVNIRNNCLVANQDREWGMLHVEVLRGRAENQSMA